MSKYMAEQVRAIADNPALLTQERECLLKYAAHLAAQAKWPSDADVIRAWGVLCESKEIADATTGDKNMLPHMRAALQSVRPPAKPEFDRALETSRRVSAVEKLIADGFVWSDGQWQAKPDAGVVTEEDVEIALTITQGPPEPPGSNSLTREFNRPKIRKALESYASRHARQVPDGWMPAPIKATEEMDAAGDAAMDAWLKDAVLTGEASNGKSFTVWIYEAMLSAAPPAPEKD